MDTRGWRDFIFGTDSVVGYDLIFTPPRQRDAVPCRVCGTLCNERRDVYEGSPAVAELGPQLALHDRFECPHRRADWHREALTVVRSIEACVDEIVRNELYARLEGILRTRRMPAAAAEL